MHWLSWLLSLQLLSPIVWLWLGQFQGNNDVVGTRIRPPVRSARPGASRGQQRPRGLSFMVAPKPVVNPFVNHTPFLSPYERAKIALMAPVIMPLRFMLAVACMAAAVSWLSVITIGVPHKQLATVPLSGFRRSLRLPTRIFTRLFLFVIGYYYIKETGKPGAAGEASVVVGNHVSFVEPLFLGGMHLLSAVSRAENGKMPLIGRGLMALQCILVDRTSATSRTATKDAIRQRSKPGSPWGQFMIFPEGTCSNTEAIISFRMGAFGPGQPVQPVAFRYPHRHHDNCWVVEGPSLPALLFRTMCQFVNHMEVVWLPVYHPNQEEKADPKLFARNVQRTIAAALDVPVTEHSFSDVLLSMDAQRRGEDPAIGTVELTKLRSFLDLNVKTAQKYLDTFVAMDVKKTGRMDLTTFAKVFGHGVTPEIQRLFELLDTDESGSLDFREYLTGLAIINEQGKQGRRSALRLAFGMFIKDGRRGIGKQDLRRILCQAIPDLTNATFEDLWRQADADNDGEVNVEEFIAFAEAHEDMLPVFRRVFF